MFVSIIESCSMKKIIALALFGFVSSVALAQTLPSQFGTTQVQTQRYSLPTAKASTASHSALSKESKSSKHAAKSGKQGKKSSKVKAKSGHSKVKAKAKGGHKVH
jgi:hypothetical protein